MSKSAVSLAALSIFAGSAYGQSGVTLYGVIDTNIEYVNSFRTPGGPSGSLVRMGSGGFAANRWGLRGVEDLGGGLSALFTIESGFNADTGTQFNSTRLYDRQSYVGLKSADLGQITFGRQYTSLLLGIANYAPMAYAPMYEPVSFMTGLNLRGDNTISYSGQFGGLTARGHWSFGNGVFGTGETPGQARANTGYGGALEYSRGDFGLALAYDQYNPTASTLGDPGVGKFRKVAIATGYNFGPVRLSGGYRWGKNDYSSGATALRDDFFWAGVRYEATPALSFTLAYYYDKLHSAQATFGGTSVSPRNPYQVSFMPSYALSKRTNVYLTTAYAKHTALNFTNVSASSTSTTYLLGAGRDSQVGAALGIRHIF